MMALSRPFKEDCLVLPLSTPLSSRRDQKRWKETRDIFMAGICCWEGGGGGGEHGLGEEGGGEFENRLISDTGYIENLVCLKTI